MNGQWPVSWDVVSMYVLPGSALLVTGLVLSVLMRRRAVHAHAVLLTAVICSLLAPAGAIAVKHWQLGVLPGRHVETPTERPSVAVATLAPETTTVPSPAEPIAIHPTDDATIVQANLQTVAQEPVAVSGGTGLTFRNTAMTLWIGAGLVLTIRLLLGFAAGLRLVRSGRIMSNGPAVEAAKSARSLVGLRRGVQVRFSASVKSPAVWCWGRTVVLLVPEKRTERYEDLKGWFCHELAHAKRHDHLSGFAVELAICLLPWQVLLWVARTRLRELSEQVCDDWAVGCGHESSNYAESLLNLTPGGQAPFMPAVARSRMGLASRVRRILADRCTSPRMGYVCGVVLILTAILLGTGVALAQRGPDEILPRSTGEPISPLHKAAAGGHLETAVKLIEDGADIGAVDANDFTPLDYAAMNGHRAMAEMLIGRGALAKPPLSRKTRPLILAAKAGHAGMVRYLIECGGDVNAGDATGKVALHHAVIEGHREVAEALIKAGTRLEIVVGSGFTALHLAAKYGHAELAKLLIQSGANIQAESPSRAAPLAVAAVYGHLGMVQLLLDEGAQIDAADYQGHTALYEAIHRCHEEIARYLISRGAAKPFNTLHLAAWLGDTASVKRLLDAGMNVDERDADEYTPLYFAGLGGKADMVRLLLDREADIEARSKTNRTVLANLAWKGRTDMVKLLLERGANVNCHLEEGPGRGGALHMAIIGGYPETAEVLLKAGAKTEVKDYCNVTPLHRAVQKDDGGVLTKLLLEHGAKVDSLGSNEEFTPLHWAAYGDRIESARLLVEHGADVNFRDKSGVSTLHKAVMSSGGTCLSPGGTCRVAELLIARGADVNAKDERGQTPLHCAAQRGSIPAVKLLLKHGAANGAADDKGWTALHYAASAGHADMAELLIQSGIKVDAQNKEGQTALGLAMTKKEDRTAIISVLKAHGAVE